MQYLSIEPGHTEELPIPGDAPRQVHLFDKESIDAVNAALAARRPLLVRGEPGTGKTQLARAVAKVLGWAYIHATIDSESVAADLLYRVDSVTRLGEAQVISAIYCGDSDNPEKREKKIRDILDEKNFLHPGPVWWAFNWESAAKYNVKKSTEPSQIDNGDPGKGRVLLIDEIDKADTDLPNGLLEAFGYGRFHPSPLDAPVLRDDRPLLVIITTNEERALPDAFLRRCLVLFLKVNNDDIIRYLVDRGKTHFGTSVDENVLVEAAKQCASDRKEWQEKNLCPPGVAEYLDLVRAITSLGTDTNKQLELIAVLSRFVLRKHPDPDSGVFPR